MTEAQIGYAPMNGLTMYCEVHGSENVSGAPIVLLHGAYMNSGLIGGLTSEFAGTRRVIVPDLQAHRRHRQAHHL